MASPWWQALVDPINLPPFHLAETTFYSHSMKIYIQELPDMYWDLSLPRRSRRFEPQFETCFRFHYTLNMEIANHCWTLWFTVMFRQGRQVRWVPPVTKEKCKQWKWMTRENLLSQLNCSSCFLNDFSISLWSKLLDVCISFANQKVYNW